MAASFGGDRKICPIRNGSVIKFGLRMAVARRVFSIHLQEAGRSHLRLCDWAATLWQTILIRLLGSS
jgi:hypothetical protein